MTTSQKLIKYLAIALAIFIICGIVGTVLSVLGITSIIFSGGAESIGEMKTYEIEDNVKTLEIDLNTVDFSVIISDSFSLESNLKYLKLNQKGNNLSISEKKRYMSHYIGEEKVILYIPENFVFEKADIEISAGESSIESLRADVLIMDMGACKVDIEKLFATNKAELDIGAGKFEIKDGEINNADVDVGVGEFKSRCKLFGENKFDIDLGKTDITLLGAKDDYKIKVDKDLGDVKFDGEVISDGTYGDGNTTVKIDVDIGSVDIRFE